MRYVKSRRLFEFKSIASFAGLCYIWLYTSSFDSAGRITDTCSGDSGGPLFMEKQGHYELVGVLKVTSFIYIN